MLSPITNKQLKEGKVTQPAKYESVNDKKHTPRHIARIT